MNIEELKELQLTHSELKALDDQEQSGVIEGYASVFGSIDSSGDTILPTAYNKVPVSYTHLTLPTICSV